MELWNGISFKAGKDIDVIDPVSGTSVYTRVIQRF
jgi:hypothetical protein